MPRTCTVCQHPERAEIDVSLVAGEPYRGIAKQYSLSESAMYRHKVEHVPPTLAQAQAEQEITRANELLGHKNNRADDLLSQVERLQKIAEGILGRTVASEDYRTSIAAIREALRCIELQGRLLGELVPDGPTVNVLIASPEWLALRAAMLRALEPYPDARAAVTRALEAGDAGR